MHVRRIDTKSVPDGDKESNEWLQNLFREKDELQESFHKHGDFFTGSRFGKVEPVLMQRRISSLLNTIGWMFVTLTPILYYLVKLLFSGELLYFSIGASILLVCKYFVGCKIILLHNIALIFLLQSTSWWEKLLECQKSAKLRRMGPSRRLRNKLMPLDPSKNIKDTIQTIQERLIFKTERKQTL